jgi:hypothetical protein
MSGLAFIIVPLAIIIVLYFILLPKPVLFPVGKVLCLDNNVPMFQVMLLDPINPQIKILATPQGAPLMMTLHTKSYITVPDTPSFSILFVDDNQSLGVISLVKINNELNYAYGGTASVGSFTITVMDSYSNITRTISPNFPNLPILVSNINLASTIPYSSYNTSGYYLPPNPISFPSQITMISYNVAPIGIMSYKTNVFLPFYSSSIQVPNEVSETIILPTLTKGETIMTIGYNYSDGSLSASLLLNQNGKCMNIYLFGGSLTQPDFSISLPTTSRSLTFNHYENH